MFLHSGLDTRPSIKSLTDSFKTQIFQQQRLSGMSVPMRGVGGDDKRRREEQLELEMRRSCGGMRARGAMTPNSGLKIRTHQLLMREMRILRLWRPSSGRMSRIRACVPSTSRICCLPPPLSYLAIPHSRGAPALPARLPPMRERLRTPHLIKLKLENCLLWTRAVPEMRDW